MTENSSDTPPIIDPDSDPRWKPIGEAGEEDGFKATVLVDGVAVPGEYECGYTWGWSNGRGTAIYPTHFKKE